MERFSINIVRADNGYSANADLYNSKKNKYTYQSAVVFKTKGELIDWLIREI
jgi:hypothetical protein